MKNDAKLGMLAGVLGVIVAAVLFAKTPPDAQPRPGPTGEPKAQETAPPTATATAPPTISPAAPNTAALASTPVVRTRKETAARPTSRSGGTEEEP
jgi:hypothetical protein